MLLLITLFSTIDCGDGSSTRAKVAITKPIGQTGPFTVTATSGQATKTVSITVTVP